MEKHKLVKHFYKIGLISKYFLFRLSATYFFSSNSIYDQILSALRSSGEIRNLATLLARKKFLVKESLPVVSLAAVGGECFVSGKCQVNIVSRGGSPPPASILTIWKCDNIINNIVALFTFVTK